MNAQTATLSQRKEAAERRLAELRRDRGSAILEARPVDHAEIARLEADVAAFGEAESEQWRRQEVERPRITARQYEDQLSVCLAADERRLEGIDRADRGMRDVGAGLATAEAEAETMRRAFQAMSNLRQPGNHDEGGLTPLSQATRLSGYIRTALRAALGGALHWGQFSLIPQPGDGPADVSWRDLEAKRTALEFLRKHAPRVPEDEDDRQAA